jgi:putative ABC transport system permease protein
VEAFEEFKRRLGVLFRRRRFEEEMEEEMRFHVELQAETNREAGMEESEAGYAARRQFGNASVVKEDSREAWGWGPLERFAQDVRFALRLLRKNPGFTATALLVLALGIGANTAIFSVVNALVLNPFPFRDPDRVVAVHAYHASGQNSNTGFREYLDWREQNNVFEEMAIVPWTGTYTLTGQGEPQRLVGGATTASFFRLAGVSPHLGRIISEEEDRPGAPRVTLLSYATWQNRFGANPNILGKTMTLDDRQYTIIGVMPKNFVFSFIRTCEFWTALRLSPSMGRFQHQYAVIARLKPGVSVAQAQADMSAIEQRLEREFPETNKGWRVAVQPARRMAAEEVKTPLAVLTSAVLFVLLLACANVAGLLLARASGRAREIGVRASLGASRGRLIRQMLTESLVLSLGGGAAGLLFAHWLMNVLRVTTPRDMAFDSTLRVDGTVLAFTLAISILTGIVFGLAPAFHGTRTDLAETIKGGSQASTGARSRHHFPNTLVAGEVALSTVLLVVSVLLAKDFYLLMRSDTGIRTENLLTFTITLPQAKYSGDHRVNQFWDELLAKLKKTPAVQSAAAVGMLPMDGGYSGGPIEIEGRLFRWIGWRWTASTTT